MPCKKRKTIIESKTVLKKFIKTKWNYIECNTVSQFLKKAELFYLCLVNKHFYAKCKALLFSKLLWKSPVDSHCKKMIVYNNFEKKIIPPYITHLEIADKKFNNDILHLPPNLTILEFARCSIFNSKLYLPSSLQRLRLPQKFSNVTEMSFHLPNLTSLYASHDVILKIGMLPSLKKILTYYKSRILLVNQNSTQISLSNSVQTLNVYNLEFFHLFPTSLTELFLQTTEVEIIENILPQSLISLTLCRYRYPITKAIFPSNLQKLEMIGYKFNISQSNILPLSLKELHFPLSFVDASSFTNITKLTTDMSEITIENCPPNITNLILGETCCIHNYPKHLTSLFTENLSACNLITFDFFVSHLQVLDFVYDDKKEPKGLQNLQYLTNLKKLYLDTDTLDYFLLPPNVEKFRLSLIALRRNCLLKTSHFNNTKNLTHLSFYEFDQSLFYLDFPTSITKINFGDCFSQFISISKLPQHIQFIKIRSKYVQNYEHLPYSLITHLENGLALLLF